MLRSIRNVKLLKCVSLICLSPLFVFYSSLNYDGPRTKFILSDSVHWSEVFQEGRGGAVLGLIFAVPLASQSPYPIIFYSVANYRLHLSHFGVYVQFSRSQLSHFLFLWIDPFFLDWVKNTLLFICCTNNLVRLLTVNMKNSFTPKNPKMCDPILVTLSKMRLHYSHSSRENINATLSSGTSPLAPCKAVPPPPP